jgi:adenylate cyclase
MTLPDTGMERKLTAILCADVYGYSRLMGQDEEATFRTLTSHRKIIDGLIEQHHGHFVNSAGDSVLAEFASVVNATQCAIEIQAAVKKENSELPPERQMEFRIGINLGDVIVDGEQIYGDGVNVAARLESLTQPGGICISGTVHDQVRDKLALVYEDVGEQFVKNIARPVHVWRVVLHGKPPRSDPRRSRRNYLRGGALSGAGLLMTVAAIFLVQHLTLKPPQTHASIPSQQKPALPLPSIPSIAVLPFVNLSGDPQQEYFSDGISDYLITNLSRNPALFVIARNSSFSYKNKTVTLQQIRRELGVRLVLEGSVLRTTNRLQINVELADTTSGANQWAQSFDRPAEDIFAVQDDILRKVVTTLNLLFKLRTLKVLGHNSVNIHPTDDLDAYDNYLRGIEHFSRDTKEDNAKARALFEKAIGLDSKYADAYAALGWTYSVAVLMQWTRNPKADLAQASDLARKALVIDDSSLLALALVCRDDRLEGRYDEAIADGERAIALDPNYALGFFSLGEALIFNGKPEAAITNIQKAIRLDPQSEDFYAVDLGAANLMMGHYREATPLLERYTVAYPNDLNGHLLLTVAYSEIGRNQEAKAQASQIMRLNSNFTMGQVGKLSGSRVTDPATGQRWAADLRKAGLK